MVARTTSHVRASSADTSSRGFVSSIRCVKMTEKGIEKGIEKFERIEKRLRCKLRWIFFPTRFGFERSWIGLHRWQCGSSSSSSFWVKGKFILNYRLKVLATCCIQGIVLPRYTGIIIKHDTDPVMHQPVQWNPKNRALLTQQDPHVAVSKWICFS